MSYKNFAVATVSTGYSNSATSIVLATGHGARLPSETPFNLVWWNASDYQSPHEDPNVEIITVTAISTDTLTVTRGAEGTAATAKNIAGKSYQVFQGITKALLDALGGTTPSFAALSGAPGDNTALAAALAAKSDATHTHSNASTSVAGFMSATDKAKLNGIEAGATGDMTGAEIATAIDAHLGSTSWRTGGGSSEELTPITASFTANGYTAFLPLNASIVRISYKVSGGSPTGFCLKDESGNIVAGISSAGSIVAVNLTSGGSGLLEGTPADLYTTSFGRLRAEASAWNGATVSLRVVLARGVDAAVSAVAPGVPASLSLGNAGSTTIEATCAAVAYAVDYEYRWSVDESNWTSGITTTTPTVARVLTGLPDDTLIYVQVRARNYVGNSSWSSSQSLSTEAAGEDGNGLLTNLVAYWKLDEASGTALDAHGSYNLTDAGGNIGQDTTNKKLGTGARTSAGGSDKRLTRGQHDAAFVSSPFTMSLWIRPTTIDSTRREIGGKWRMYIDSGYQLYVQSGELRWWISADGYQSGGGQKYVASAVSANNWYHVVCGYDGTSMFLIVNDGTPITDTIDTPWVDTAAHFALFGFTDATAQTGFVGQMDEVGYWSRTLSPAEITALYNAGNALSYDSFTS